MSTFTEHRTPVLRQRAGAADTSDTRPPARPYRASRPPESELASSRGVVLALLMVLPFWLCLAAVTTLA